MLDRLRQKIIANVKLADGDNPCWRWTGAVNGSGYGALTLGGIWFYAHRASYIIFHGEIPKGKLIRHRCHCKTCVSPWHLVPGSYRDNAYDHYRRKELAYE
jgi:hypothetical protein